MKKTTPSFRHSADVLSYAANEAGLTVRHLTSLRTWLAEQLSQHAYAKLGQGGHALNQVPLRQVFVDLPTSDGPADDSGSSDRALFLSNFLKGKPVDLKKECAPAIEEVDRELWKAVAELRRTVRSMGDASRNFGAVLLIGGPGQGKSTLGQLACQLHRAALLQPFEDQLISEHRELLRTFTARGRAKDRILRLPSKPLIPLQISLPDFIGWLSKNPLLDSKMPSLIDFITSFPSAKANGLSSEILLAVISKATSLLVLDGFDEVGATQDRLKIVQAAQELLGVLTNNGASVQILATTRPQGYAGELAQIGVKLDTLYLVPLRKEEALEYARRLLDAKIFNIDERAQALNRLKEAASESATERLLTSPLQVTIFAALVQQIGRAPRERWNLFLRFFSYTYEREVERGTYASKLLSDYRVQIERIHARVALLLQVEAERDGGASARMPRRRLEQVIDAVLLEDGFSDFERRNLVKEIAKAAEERLVFLIEAEPLNFGFDIRSLQEFMAAWALTSGRESEIEARLHQVAKASMFRNVFLFIASRFFSEGSPLREILATKICVSLDESVNLAFNLSKTGAMLAVEILEEGAVLSQPRHARALLERACRLLELSVSHDHIRLARASTDEIRQPLRNTLESIIRKLDVDSKSNILAAWVCVIELVNLGDQWAANFADEYWSEIENPSLLIRHCFELDLQLGNWILGKIESDSARIDPSDFIGAASQMTRVSNTWTYWFAKTIYIEERWNFVSYGTDLPRINVGQRAKIEFPTHPCPSEWKAWFAIANYELNPSAKTLNEALKKIIVNKCFVQASRLDNHFSWPLSICLRAANSLADLKFFIKELDSGKLGEVQDWLEAEKNWQTDFPNLDSLLAMAEGVPWSLAQLSNGPPLLAVPVWNAAHIIRIKRGKGLTQSIHNAARVYRESSCSPVKRWLAKVSLTALTLTSIERAEDLPLEAWMRDGAKGIFMLVPRPRNISMARWHKLLSIASDTNPRWIIRPQQILRPSVEEIGHTIFLRLIIAAMSRGSFNYADWQVALEKLLDIFKSATRLSDKDKKYIDLIKLFKDGANLSSDDDLVSWVINEDDDTTFAALSGVRQWPGVSFERSTKILCLLYMSLPADSKRRTYIISQLRDALNDIKSGLENETIWARLMLPLPSPDLDEKSSSNQMMVLRTVSLKHLALSDVGGIKGLRLDFPLSSEDKGQWVIIIGPNGVGKTTILRSVALAVRNAADPSIWPRGSFSRRWQRLDKEGGSTSESTITVEIDSGEKYITKIRSADGMVVTQIPIQTRPSIFPIFAYGCRRGSYLRHSSADFNMGGDSGPEIGTLFDDESGLVDVEAWLTRLDGDAPKRQESEELLKVVFEALKEMLALEDVRVKDMEVWVKEFNRPEIPFNCLSDGYLASANWVIDLIARWSTMANDHNVKISSDLLGKITGLVLIDEIDVHLHPEWQLEVISRTRKLLPRMSFIVTTHNPLTLVGASAAEIWQINKADGDISAIPGSEAPMLLTGGQIYKQYFGIADTLPKEVGRDFRRFSFLSGYAMRDDEEEAELIALRRKLQTAGIDPQWEIVPREVNF
jgi:hypothetical protein